MHAYGPTDSSETGALENQGGKDGGEATAGRTMELLPNTKCVHVNRGQPVAPPAG